MSTQSVTLNSKQPADISAHVLICKLNALNGEITLISATVI